MRFPYAILTTLKYDQIRLLDETRARTEYRNFPATQKVWMITMRRGKWRNIRTSTRTGRMVPATRVKFAVCKWTVKGRRPEETGLFYIFRCQRCVCATANRPRACRFGLREGNLHNMSIRACNTTNTHSRWKRIKKKKKKLVKYVKLYDNSFQTWDAHMLRNVFVSNSMSNDERPLFSELLCSTCVRIQSFRSVSFRNNHRDTRHSKRFFMFSNNYNLFIYLFIFLLFEFNTKHKKYKVFSNVFFTVYV